MNTAYKLVYLAITCLLMGIETLSAQGKFWVYLKDKPLSHYDYREYLSPEAIEKRQLMGIPLVQETDRPLDSKYLQLLQQQGIKIIVGSKWLNAISSALTSEQIVWLKKQPFVLRVTSIQQPTQTLSYTQTRVSTTKNNNYSLTLSQMEPQAFKAAGLNAKGVLIGVIDAGFFGAQKSDALTSVFEENRILGVKDWVNPDKTKHFEEASTFSDWHGTQVLEMIAGNNISSGKRTGFASQASFYLARTDDGNNEFRGEEDYWIGAMEWMDSLGVRIINTSLGYARGFDNPKENHEPFEMNGKTTVISKAAQIAVDEKGLLLVVSAGNEGNDGSWKVVSAPADAQGVVSVGATNRVGLKAGYSSIGPAQLPYLKPDVSCYSNDGTSFSAPVITGFAACLMQLNMKASNKEIIAALQQSAPFYPYGNNYVGYGIPQASRAINLMNEKPLTSTMQEKKAFGKSKVVIKLPASIKGQAILFHKKNNQEVIKTQLIKYTNGKLKLKKPKEGQITTVLLENNTGIEILWKKN